MAIESSTPLIIPPQPEISYPLRWLLKFGVDSPSFESAGIYALLKYYRELEEGTEGTEIPDVTASTVKYAEFAPVEPEFWSDHDIFSIHERKPDCEEGIRAVLSGYGINLPPDVPSNLFLLNLVARCIAACAENDHYSMPPAPPAQPPVDESGTDTDGTESGTEE